MLLVQDVFGQSGRCDVRQPVEDCLAPDTGDQTAGPGWDAGTGLGTPIGTALLNLFTAHTIVGAVGVTTANQVTYAFTGASSRWSRRGTSGRGCGRGGGLERPALTQRADPRVRLRHPS